MALHYNYECHSAQIYKFRVQEFLETKCVMCVWVVIRYSTVVAACGPVLGAKLAWCTDARQLRDKYGAAAGENYPGPGGR